jgi:hypothetical protein
VKTKLSFAIAAGVAAVLALAGSPAAAADLRAEIPFSFQMGGKTLPAGTYQVSTSQAVLGVTGHEGGAFVMTNRLEANGYLETGWEDPTLVFERKNGDYVLVQVWTGSRNGRSLKADSQTVVANDEPWFGAVAQDVTRVAIPLL